VIDAVSTADSSGIALSTVDREYRRNRRSVFAGIFAGYAAYYLVRNNLALAIPDILAAHPEYSKADLGWALTGSSIAYGVSKFLMGSVSDRSNPKYFLPLGLLLSCALMTVSGVFKAIYALLALVIVIQIANGWVQGMGWPPCGKTMVHWFSTKERGLVVSVWNVAHNVGGGLVASFALFGVTLFGDWGAKFYFNAAIAAAVAVAVFFLMRDTPQSLGLPAVEEYKNDYPPHYNAASERTFTYREIFVGHVLNNSGPSPSRTRSSISCAMASRTGFRPICRPRKDSRSSNRASAGRSTSTPRFRVRSRAAGCRTRSSKGAAPRPPSSSWA
jgi:OPA family glycerol-3-phosphate transporter-like MFS transporter